MRRHSQVYYAGISWIQIFFFFFFKLELPLERARVMKCKPFFFLCIWSQKGGSFFQTFLVETAETGHENLVDVFYNSARYSAMSKGKNILNVLANGVIFSMLKHTDPNTVSGRSTSKVGK